jgi:cytochrome c-type biogenesis protein CcmE
MRRRPRIATLLGLALVVAAFLVLVAISLTSALVYYVTPTELASARPSTTVRLYGVVVPGSVEWNTASRTLAFQVTDGTTTVDVSSTALPTALFRDGIGVVLVGQATDAGHFVADELLVKHSEVYEPLRPGETIPPNILEQIRAPEASP